MDPALNRLALLQIVFRQLNVQKEGYAEDIGGCLGDVYAVLKYLKDFGGSFHVVGGCIVIILLPMKQFLGSCLASSDL
jgi:hypothetical protein